MLKNFSKISMTACLVLGFNGYAQAEDLKPTSFSIGMSCIGSMDSEVESMTVHRTYHLTGEQFEKDWGVQFGKQMIDLADLFTDYTLHFRDGSIIRIMDSLENVGAINDGNIEWEFVAILNFTTDAKGHTVERKMPAVLINSDGVSRDVVTTLSLWTVFESQFKDREEFENSDFRNLSGHIQDLNGNSIHVTSAKVMCK